MLLIKKNPNNFVNFDIFVLTFFVFKITLQHIFSTILIDKYMLVNLYYFLISYCIVLCRGSLLYAILLAYC